MLSAFLTAYLSIVPVASAQQTNVRDPAGAQPPKPSAVAREAVEPATQAEQDSESEADDISEDEAPPAQLVAKPSPGPALARQVASAQRQLRRNQRSAGDFFSSLWLSDAPSFSTGTAGANIAPSAPEDCEPLDRTIADAYIRDSATREGVSMDLVREIVRKESGFNPCAVSAKGAIGMMQLMPATAESLGIADPFDARQNIDGGVRHLKRLIEKYNGRPDLALAAYNAGEGAVDSNSDIPPYEETREYVSTIMKRVFEEKPKPNTPPKIEPITPVRIPSSRPFGKPAPPMQEGAQPSP